jgi:hypothetical protein
MPNIAFDCQMLLYPALPIEWSKVHRRFGIGGGREKLSIATVDLVASRQLPDILRQITASECVIGN